MISRKTFLVNAALKSYYMFFSLTWDQRFHWTNDKKDISRDKVECFHGKWCYVGTCLFSFSLKQNKNRVYLKLLPQWTWGEHVMCKLYIYSVQESFQLVTALIVNAEFIRIQVNIIYMLYNNSLHLLTFIMFWPIFKIPFIEKAGCYLWENFKIRVDSDQ